jgi:hypothetical protein
MAFVNANQTRLIYGTNPLAAYLKSVGPSFSADMLDATTLADTSKVYVAGQTDYTLNVDGLFDSTTTAGEVWANITAAISATSTVPVSVAPEGFAVGNSVWVLPVKTGTYEVGGSVADLVTFTMAMQPADVPAIGRSLSDLTAYTATTNGTSVDNSAASSNGAVANLHVTAATGTSPTLAVTIQHSTNNSTWTTLATFTTATAATSETVAVTGTVNRYTRAVFTVGGTTPSFTAQVSLARK